MGLLHTLTHSKLSGNLTHYPIEYYLFIFSLVTIGILWYENKVYKTGTWNIVVVYGLVICFGALDVLSLFGNISSINHKSIGMLLFFAIISLREIRDYYDLYEQSKLMEHYKAIASLDLQTGLKNRVSFTEALKEYKNILHYLAVVSFDIDNLKAVNDSYGHSQGDEMIISVGHRINQVFGPDGSCYRMSGDEFVCVFEGYPEETLHQKGSALIQLLKEDNMKTPYPISVSMGIAKFDPVLDGSFDDLLNRSDQLMYEDKKRQKNKNLTR